MGMREAYHRIFHQEDKTLLTTMLESSGFGVEAEVPMKNIVEYRKTNLKFNLAVTMYTAFSVGNGFYNSADESNPTGRKCLEMIDQFCDEWDVDTLNQKIAMDVWASGNAFLEPLGTKEEPLKGIQILPLSSFQRIKRDSGGDVEEYIQYWGGRTANLDPAGIYHFSWMSEDANAWGTGLGQPLARKGTGYKTGSGKTVHRPDHFAISEMIEDIQGKMVYAGLPRYAINAPNAKPEDITKLTDLYNNLDPLQHLVTNTDSKVDTISLDTQNRFESFLRNIDDNILSGVKTPIPRMWSALNFTYASAESALEATFPLIRMYQRAHKRFIENFIYKVLILQEGKDVKKADVHLNWGQQEPLTIPDIKIVSDMLNNPKFGDLVEPESVVDMLIEAGVPLRRAEQKEAELAPQIRDLKRALNSKDKKVQLAELNKAEQLQALKLKILKKVANKYGY